MIGLRMPPASTHPVITLKQLVCVIGEKRNAIFLFQTQFSKRIRQSMSAFTELCVRELLFAVNDTNLFGKQRLRAISKLQWTQWDKHTYSSFYPIFIMNTSQRAHTGYQ